jgi:hypothetical protein
VFREFRHLAFGALAGGLVPANALAGDRSSLQLEWSAPEGCPTEESVLGRIAELTGAAPGGPEVVARVAVTTPDAGGWSASRPRAGDGMPPPRTSKGMAKPRTGIGWCSAAALLSLTLVACGGRVLVGSLACGDPDSGASSDDAAGDVACAPEPCSITGAWQLSGAEFVCSGGACSQPLPACTPGAIRFDPSGALYRLTTAGWEPACSFTVCGDRVSGAQLSNVLTSSYSASSFGDARSCGPWDLFLSSGSFDAGTGNLATCNLDAYAPCAGGATRSNGPPELTPWTVEVSYSRCSP